MLLPGPAALDELERRFGAAWLDSNGVQINVGCPFCSFRGLTEDLSGHLGLNFEKDAAHCVRCDWGRLGLRAWLRSQGITQNIGDARLSFQELAAGKRKTAAIAEFKHTSIDLPDGAFILDDAEFSIGTVFARSMLDKRISKEEAKRHVLYGSDSGKTRGYVIFPYFEDDEVVYWQGRACDPDAELRKYNPSAKEAPLGKSYWLYNMEMAMPEANLYLVEGSLDTITLQSFLLDARPNDHIALGLSGTAMSFPDSDTHPLNTQFGKICSLRPKSITVVFDKDAYRKAVALAELLSICGFDARAVEVMSKDPNEAPPEELDRILKAETRQQELLDKAKNIILPQYDFTTRRDNRRNGGSKVGNSPLLRYKF